MVFYCVVCPPWQHLGDLGPFVAVDAVRPHESFLFMPCPGLLLYGRIELIMPSGNPSSRSGAGSGVISGMNAAVAKYYVLETS